MNIDNIKVFENIKERSKRELQGVMSIIDLNKKEILFEEKEYINDIYFLKSGKISIYKINENGERKIIFILKDGDMINEVLIDDNKNTSFGCEVFENAIVIKCSSEHFIKVMEEDFILSKNVLSHTQNLNRRLYRQLKNSISIRIDKKLAAKLYRMGKEFGIKKGEWTYINADINITYIADMLGCKRESLSRAMKQLQENELVKITNKKIYIKKDGLSKYFKHS